VNGEGLGAVVIAMLVVAGCSSDAAQVHSQTAQQVRLTVGPECSIEYKTLATASEAYWALTGAAPVNQGVLVDEGLLREEIDDFDLLVNDDDYHLNAVGACTGFDPTADTVPEAEEPADEMNCAADLKTLQTAWEAYYANTGNPPASEQDLVDAGLLQTVSTVFDLVGTEFIAVSPLCA
jgi:outer membrane murein-binding lipoprotein Lpp